MQYKTLSNLHIIKNFGKYLELIVLLHYLEVTIF